mgnify:CR=1 FL=1
MPNENRTMVVAGSSGVVGRHLISRAKETGWTVRVLSRSNEEETLWNPEKIIEGDHEELENVRDALEGSDLLVNLAGASLADGKLGIDHSKKVLNSRIHSTRALTMAYRDCKNPPPCWIQASAIGFYGEAGEADITEESPQGDLFLSQVCQAWEETAREIKEMHAHPPRLIFLRLGLVFAADAPAWKKMIVPIRMGLGGALGEGTQWYAWIEASDMAKAIFFLHDNPESERSRVIPQPLPPRSADFHFTS